MPTYISQPVTPNGEDAYLDDSNPNTNFGSNTLIRIGQSGGVIFRSWVKFDLSSIPSTSTIVSAELELEVQADGSTNARTLYAHRMKRNAVESEITWNEYSSGNNWQTAGASGANDVDLTAMGSGAVGASPSPGDKITITLTPAKVQELIDGTYTNYGFFLEVNNFAESSDRIDYWSSDHGTQADNPKLTIVYIEKIEPDTIYGLGDVYSSIVASTVYALGSVNSVNIRQVFVIPDQRPRIATPGIADYKVRIKNQDGEPVAELDNWISLNYTHKTNYRGTCRLEINGEDSRIQYLIPDKSNTDNQIEVWRRNPLVGLDWYIEWEGLLRTNNDLYEQNDNNKLVAFGFSYLDLARRAEIKWAAGSAYANKSDVGETVMKAYVSENIGPAALLASGREADNVMPGLSIQADNGAGLSWSGAMADKKLLATLQEIAIATGVDFDIIGVGAALFRFVTYDGYKTDRTVENSDGNAPVIFSLGFGNLIVPLLSKNRSEEATAVYALGKGTDDARQSALVESDSKNDSPWNRIEETISASNTSGDDLESAAETELGNKALDIKLTFQVLQTLSTYYGKHYTWGDLVTARFKEETFDKKVTEVNVTVSGNSKGEQIGITFADK